MNNIMFDRLCVISVPVRRNIGVREFPDYVLDMAREGHDNRSKLAIEYMVSVCATTTKDCVGYETTNTLQQLHRVPTLPFEVACLSQNITLNRFRNIYPCKHQPTLEIMISQSLQMMVQECH